MKSPMAIDPRLGTAGLNRKDSAYLWPLSHTLNPNFKGVIFVDGKVAISGKVRGRFTLASPYDIVIADDVTLQDNAASDCADYLGLFSGANVVMADNLLNSPQMLGSAPDSVMHLSSTQDEIVQATILALGGFVVENYSSGVAQGESCGADSAGRGCLFLTGGIIQGTRGSVGTLNAGQTAGRVRLHQAVRVQRVRTHLPAAVFPDDGPVHCEPYVRDGSGECGHPPVLQDPEAGIARGIVQEAATAAAGSAGTAA